MIMIRKPRIVAALLRLYPAAWRAEYGPELEGILLARPLGPRVIVDVLWNGLRQRARASEPSTILGLASMLVVLAVFILGGGAYGRGSDALLLSTWKILPTVAVTFLAAGVFALLQVACGCWTHLRHRGTVHQSGLSAMKTSLITGIPVVLAGLLMVLGMVDVRFPGTTLPPPSPVLVLIAPLARLPDAWIWGALGGLLGRRFTSLRQSAGAIRP
jgi:hypothetical protein